MRNVKSVTELKQLALQTGATVDLGGRRFNTSGERMRPAPKPAPPPAEIKADPPPPPPPPPSEIRVDMSGVAAAQARVGEMMAQALASIPRPQAPVREWLFTIERGKDGLLTAIRATAQE